MWYIFEEKKDCSRISKITFPCVERTNTKIQTHKYTNRVYEEVSERPKLWYILKRGLFNDIENHILVCYAHMQNNVPEGLNMWYIFEK